MEIDLEKDLDCGCKAGVKSIHCAVKDFGVGRRFLADNFFNYTYKFCKVFERKGVTVEDEEELCHELMKQFDCNACTESFDNLLNYELHYRDLHQFVCAQCNRWSPTARLLDIHVQEKHDSFFQLLAEKQPMYQCFVIDCDLKFKDPLERRTHCREFHMFPKNYRFDELNNMKSKKKKASQKVTPMETNLTESAAKKKNKVYLGKNHQKGFTREIIEIKKPVISTTDDPKPEKILAPFTMFIPRQVDQQSFAKVLTDNKTAEKNVLESQSIMDLADSLPSIK